MQEGERVARLPAAPAAPAAVPALLVNLPPVEYERLRPAVELVRLSARQVLHDTGERITHVYFPADALVALFTVMSNGQTLATGLVDREGMVGLPVFLGTGVAHQRAVCQQPGDAWRLPAETLRAALALGGALPERLLTYTGTSLRVAAQFGACSRLHEVERRCASVLLMLADRLGTERFPLTQQSLAEMLSVRRQAVVEAFAVLVRAGLIEHRYGRVTIADRPRLAAAACECYETLLGPA